MKRNPVEPVQLASDAGPPIGDRRAEHAERPSSEIVSRSATPQSSATSLVSRTWVEMAALCAACLSWSVTAVYVRVTRVRAGVSGS